MKRITIKFYRKLKFSDSTNRFHTSIEYGQFNNKIMGNIVCTCKGFPDVKVTMGPFVPEGLVEIQKDLTKQESEGSIINLVMEEEVTVEGFEISMTSDQIRMN